MDMCYAALAAAFYLFTDRIKEVGDPWTLDGDLADFIGDFVGGFGNADVPIWRGVDGVVALGLPEVPGVPWGPCLDRFVVESCQSCHTVPVWPFSSTLHSPTHSHRLHEDSMGTLHESPWTP